MKSSLNFSAQPAAAVHPTHVVWIYIIGNFFNGLTIHIVRLIFVSTKSRVNTSSARTMSRKRLRSETRKAKEQADASPKLVSFQKSEVPTYLHRSEFFLSLEDDDDQQILVPRECFKDSDTISSVEDLRSLLLTLRFWVADEITESILDFVFNHSFKLYEEVFVEFYDDMPDLIRLKAILKSRNPFQKAINCGVLRCVQYLFMTGKYEWPEDVCEQLAGTGNLCILQFAATSGRVLTIEATVEAASSDHLAGLKFLHEHNCPWTDAAVVFGSLACLKYAHENGCGDVWPHGLPQVRIQSRRAPPGGSSRKGCFV